MGHKWKCVPGEIDKDTWNWSLGLVYIVAVAAIWIVASYLVQSVVDAGVSPFLLSYMCNSFLVYIPIVEIARCCEGLIGNIIKKQQSGDPENVSLLQENVSNRDQYDIMRRCEDDFASVSGSRDQDAERLSLVLGDAFAQRGQSYPKGRWTHSQVAKVSLLICPFWFLAQLTFNLSLKYTTVTLNTILSSTSSLFTFLVSLAFFLGERFTWIKLISVLLCMGGTVIVGLADSESGVNAIATNPVLGDVLSFVSACLYAVDISLIRKKLPDEKKERGKPVWLSFSVILDCLID